MSLLLIKDLICPERSRCTSPAISSVSLSRTHCTCGSKHRRSKVKVGHGGTLDPMATGVLVIGVGRGCRELSNYLKVCHKRWLFSLLFFSLFLLWYRKESTIAHQVGWQIMWFCMIHPVAFFGRGNSRMFFSFGERLNDATRGAS